MTDNEIKDKAKQIIADTLGINQKDINDDSDFQEDFGVDSLDALDLLMAIETGFDIAVQEGETDKIKTVGDMLNMLVNKVQTD